MLRLILVVVLKVGTSSDQVERVGDHAADGVGREGGRRRHDCQVERPIRTIVPFGVEPEHQLEVCLEKAVDGVEDAREGHVSDQRHLQSREEASCALFHYDLAEGVCHARVLLEAHHFEARFDHDERVRYDALECA